MVTANSDLMARHGAELLELAAANRNIFYEASVGGGSPVRPLKHCLVANRIERIIGIINGTTNYILTRMIQDDMEFDAALSRPRRSVLPRPTRRATWTAGMQPTSWRFWPAWLSTAASILTIFMCRESGDDP